MIAIRNQSELQRPHSAERREVQDEMSQVLVTLQELAFESTKTKGQKFLDMMQGDSESVPQSSFTREDLSKWGWSESQEPCNIMVNYKDMLSDFGSNSTRWSEDDKEGHNVDTTMEHFKKCIVGGTTYYATAGMFQIIANGEAGLLVASNSLSPYTSAVDNHGLPLPEDRPLPLLQNWSDLAFLHWQSLQKLGKPNELKYVLRANIENETSTKVMSEILGYGVQYQELEHKPSHGCSCETCRLPLWPGVTFDAGSKEGQALIGTPNGGGVAWLLAQHKEQLGVKVIDKVTLFFSTPVSEWDGTMYSAPNMLFHIKHVKK